MTHTTNPTLDAAHAAYMAAYAEGRDTSALALEYRAVLEATRADARGARRPRRGDRERQRRKRPGNIFP